MDKPETSVVKLLSNGKRASKNHNLIKPFIEKSLNLWTG